MPRFFRTFWRNSVFWLLFVFSLFCCRSFFVVTCIVNWLMTGFFLWFCSKIVHRRAVLVIIAPHLKCTYMHAFPALGLYFLQIFLWIKLNHNNNKLLIRTRKKISVSVYPRVVFEKITCHWVLIFYLSECTSSGRRTMGFFSPCSLRVSSIYRTTFISSRLNQGIHIAYV